MKHTEKWRTFDKKLEYTRFKLITGALLSVLLIVIIGYIGYGSFQRILFSLDQLSTPRKETVFVQELVTTISELQNCAGTYAITMKASDLQSYVLKRKNARQLIDSLRVSIGEEDYYEKVDSLNFFFNEYIRSLNEWLVIKSANPKGVMNQLYETIEEGDSSLIGALNNIPRSEITTITTTIEKPVLISKEEEEIKDPKNSKGFFKRVFGGGSKTEKKPNTDPNKNKATIQREVTTETRVKPDTNYYHQVDTLLVRMKASLNQAETLKDTYNKRLKKRAIHLLENNLVLINRVNQLLKNIDEQEEVIARQQLTESKASAHQSYHKLMLLSWAGGIFALLFVYILFTDISKSLYYKGMLQEATLKAQKLAKVKEDFLANMSHEIRTPLNSIIGYVDQLSSVSFKNKEIPPLKVLESSSQHLLNLVNDILDYSKIESGAFRLEQIGFCPDDVVKEAIDVLLPEANQKDLQLTYEPGDGVYDVLSGDPVRLKQILINLIGNGIKFTDRGYVTVLLHVQKKNNQYVLKCQVKDSGIGIDKGKNQQIFDEFSQADTSITRKYGGTGLGLSISKKIIESQKGEIQVQSIIGSGSTFSFQIPYAKASYDEYKIKQRVEKGDRHTLKGKHILVIDDDEMSHVLLKPVFLNWRMDATFCTDAQEAWILLRKEKYDLVMLDLQMPVLDGWELIDRIRNNEESFNKEVCLLLCTANVLINDESINHLVNGLLYKPFKYVQLWDALIEAFNSIPVENKASHNSHTLTKACFYTLENVKLFANGDQQQLRLFIETFISSSRLDLSQMKQFLEKDNFVQVGELAHKLKNMCAQLEATEVLHPLEWLEQLTDGRLFPATEVYVWVNELDGKFGQLLEKLEEEVVRLKFSDSKI